MIYVYCDVGVKNFCYLVVKKHSNILLEFIEFDIKEFSVKDVISDVLDMLEDLMERYEIIKFGIELQNFRNTRCVKIETVIATYLTLKNIHFNRIQAQTKLRRLNITTSSYSKRKKEAILKGEELIKQHEYSKIIDKISTLKKKDDLYDCILMAIVDLL